MNFIKKNKILLIPVILLIVVIAFYFIREYLASREIYNISYEEYIMNPKKYGVNEYSIMNISDEQMASIYFNKYKNQLFNNLNEAYNSLNLNYRNNKFGSYEKFVEYANSINFSNMIMDEYAVTNCESSKCYYIYDKSRNLYLFKTDSVMEYELFLEDIY